MKEKLESVWGKPNRSFYVFLNYLEALNNPKTLCILGCSDGKFVVPAARKNFEVLAIDIDEIAMYGGEYINNNGEKKFNIGMVNRLKQTNLLDKVEIVNKNYMEYTTGKKFSGVFTSGSIHYFENSRYRLSDIIEKQKSFVAKNGLLFHEYIHLSEYDNDKNRHFLDKRSMESFFKNPEWSIIKHRKRLCYEKPNPRNNKGHNIVWGSIIVRKN